jgi:aerobic C4-dicarboxylate transport protein
MLMLTSKGGTTVAGGAFVKLAATLQSVRMLPLSGLGLLFGVDRLMAIALSVTNMIGNTVAVFAIARWENALDDTMFRAYLAECIAAKEPDFGLPADESDLAAPLLRGEHE